MPTQDKTVNLQDLDIFVLLRLDHLPEEKKLKRLAQMQQIVLTDFINTNLPNYLKDKDVAELEELSKKKPTPEELEDFLGRKIRDFDLIMAKKFLEFKKQLVRNNIQMRIDLNEKEREKLKDAPGGDEKLVISTRLEKERDILNRILVAIDQDDWRSVRDLIQEL